MASWFFGPDFLPAGIRADHVEFDGKAIRVHAALSRTRGVLSRLWQGLAAGPRQVPAPAG
jgi:hypothetical protein